MADSCKQPESCCRPSVSHAVLPHASECSRCVFSLMAAVGVTRSFLHSAAVSAAVCRYGAVLVLQAAMTLGDLNAFMLYAI